MSASRQLRAIGPLPATATVLVPAAILWLTHSVEVGWDLPAGLTLVPVLIGAALIASGVALFWRTVALFARAGDGTLAPWDPPRHLVVRGPYRHMRHPMISAVACVLLGEAALLGSPPLAAWLLAFVLANAIYLPLVEEPRLTRRFGEAYVRYRANVPRWLPRRRPWEPDKPNRAGPN